jgi:hypothetical protein
MLLVRELGWGGKEEEWLSLKVNRMLRSWSGFTTRLAKRKDGWRRLEAVGNKRFAGCTRYRRSHRRVRSAAVLPRVLSEAAPVEVPTDGRLRL